jgi:hypothetical protein
MNSTNPFLQADEPPKETYVPIQINPSEDKHSHETRPNRKTLLQSLWKLVRNKPSGYQLKDSDLLKCGVSIEQCDRVREAITKADSARPNFILDFFVWVFSQIGNFLDTIIKLILTVGIFALSLQVPYLNEQANTQLQNMVSEAAFNDQKYAITIKQLGEILARYNVKESKVERAVPEQVKQDHEQSQHWMKYKGSSVESIWQQIPKDWAHSRDKIDDLLVIYKKTVATFKPGLPANKQSYVNAGLITLIALLSYIILQALFAAFCKNTLRKISIQNELRRIF